MRRVELVCARWRIWFNANSKYHENVDFIALNILSKRYLVKRVFLDREISSWSKVSSRRRGVKLFLHWLLAVMTFILCSGYQVATWSTSAMSSWKRTKFLIRMAHLKRLWINILLVKWFVIGMFTGQRVQADISVTFIISFCIFLPRGWGFKHCRTKERVALTLRNAMSKWTGCCIFIDLKS